MSTLTSWLLIAAVVGPVLLAGLVLVLRVEQRWDRDEIDELVQRRRARERSGSDAPHPDSPSLVSGHCRVRVGDAATWPADVDGLLTPHPHVTDPHVTGGVPGGRRRALARTISKGGDPGNGAVLSGDEARAHPRPVASGRGTTGHGGHHN